MRFDDATFAINNIQRANSRVFQILLDVAEELDYICMNDCERRYPCDRCKVSSLQKRIHDEIEPDVGSEQMADNSHKIHNELRLCRNCKHRLKQKERNCYENIRLKTSHFYDCHGWEREQVNSLLTMSTELYKQLQDWQINEIMKRMSGESMGWEDSDGIEWVAVYLKEAE